MGNNWKSAQPGWAPLAPEPLESEGSTRQQPQPWGPCHCPHRAGCGQNGVPECLISSFKGSEKRIHERENAKLTRSMKRSSNLLMIQICTQYSSKPAGRSSSGLPTSSAYGHPHRGILLSLKKAGGPFTTTPQMNLEDTELSDTCSHGETSTRRFPDTRSLQQSDRGNGEPNGGPQEQRRRGAGAAFCRLGVSVPVLKTEAPELQSCC